MSTSLLARFMPRRAARGRASAPSEPIAEIIRENVFTHIILDVLESLHARMIEQSVSDPLTGAYGRRHMETCVQHVLERHRRTQATASMLVVDIDRFKAAGRSP